MSKYAPTIERQRLAALAIICFVIGFIVGRLVPFVP